MSCFFVSVCVSVPSGGKGGVALLWRCQSQTAVFKTGVWSECGASGVCVWSEKKDQVGPAVRPAEAKQAANTTNKLGAAVKGAHGGTRRVLWLRRASSRASFSLRNQSKALESSWCCLCGARQTRVNKSTSLNTRNKCVCRWCVLGVVVPLFFVLFVGASGVCLLFFWAGYGGGVVWWLLLLLFCCFSVDTTTTPENTKLKPSLLCGGGGGWGGGHYRMAWLCLSYQHCGGASI